MPRRVVPTPPPESPHVRDLASLGAFIREQRTRQGLRIDDAAALCGVSVQLLHSLETGGRAVRLDKVLHVAKQLGVALLAVPAEDLPAALHALRTVGEVPATAEASVAPSAALQFWHPVGAHVGESLAQIVSRKRREINQHGFTLWSFASATPGKVGLWHRALHAAGQTSAPAICTGTHTRDPGGPDSTAHWAWEYSADLQTWHPVPAGMTSYHRPPGKSGVLASAFFLRDIAVPAGLHVRRPTTWLRVHPPGWESSGVPPRGEYLVADPVFGPHGSPVHIVLDVHDPFVVWLR